MILLKNNGQKQLGQLTGFDEGILQFLMLFVQEKNSSRFAILTAGNEIYEK